MFAAVKGNIECVEILAPLEKRMANSWGRTALMHAVTNGRLDCVKALAPLEKGIRDRGERTALSYTTWLSSNIECAQFLWRFSEERAIDNLKEVKERYNIQRVSCE